MRTTLHLNDDLVAEAEAAAAKERTTLTRLVEEGLALRLRTTAASRNRRRTPLRVYPGKGGLSPAVRDPCSNEALLDAADGEEAG